MTANSILGHWAEILVFHTSNKTFYISDVSLDLSVFSCNIGLFGFFMQNKTFWFSYPTVMRDNHNSILKDTHSFIGKNCINFAS